MKKNLKIIVIIELQLIIALAVFFVFKVNKIEKRVFETNKLLYRTMISKETEELNKVNTNDIVIGDENAPISMFIYSKVNCSACETFFSDAYYNIKWKFVNNGDVKLIIRYLVHPSEPLMLYSTKCMYYANLNGVFDDYSSYLMQHGISDSTEVKKGLEDLLGESEELNSYLINRRIDNDLIELATSARKTQIRSTPTFYIGREKFVGTRPYAFFERVIKSELEINACD